MPCELWHFDKGKPLERRDKVLMLDARNIYRKVTRKIFDFSPEQLNDLTAVVWLYRGQSDRFVRLVQEYLDRTIVEARAIAPLAAAFRRAYEGLVEATGSFLTTLPHDAELRVLSSERDDAARVCFASLDEWTTRIGTEWQQPCESVVEAQNKRLAELAMLAEACRDLVKDADMVATLSARVVDIAEQVTRARDHDEWDGRAIGRFGRELDAARERLVNP